MALLLCDIDSDIEVDSTVSNNISLKILCEKESDINAEDIFISINDFLIFEGPNNFYFPWNGDGSLMSEGLEAYGSDIVKSYNFILNYCADPLPSEKELLINVTIHKICKCNLKTENISFGLACNCNLVPIFNNTLKLKVEKYDFGPPFLCELNPIDNQKNVDREIKTHVKLKILDENGNINENLLHIDINNQVAFDGSVGFYYPWNGPDSNILAVNELYNNRIAGGFWIVLDYIDEKLPLNKVMNVHVTAPDLYYNYIDSYYSFTTIEGPVISNMELDGASGVNPNALISFNISDGYFGIDVSTINVTINGQPALNGNMFISPFDGPNSSFSYDGYDGYNIVIDKIDKYKSRESVSIDVQVKDRQGNG